MKPAQLLLGYQRLVERERELRDDIERLETLLHTNPDVAAATEALDQAKSAQQSLELRLRESDRERETHRGRLRMRERDLMSGRIRNPTELMQLNQEVEHMRASFAEEEAAELQLMEEGEAAEEAVREASARLDDARTRFAGDEPGLRRELESLQSELESVKADSAASWSQIPPAFQSAFLRIRAHPAVAEVDHTQCQECHVTVTSSGMQALRKGEEVVQCDNCGRVLVIA
jgi:predicted  nucleic acid-binding Zn-ribbon protein